DPVGGDVAEEDPVDDAIRPRVDPQHRPVLLAAPALPVEVPAHPDRARAEDDPLGDHPEPDRGDEGVLARVDAPEPAASFARADPPYRTLGRGDPGRTARDEDPPDDAPRVPVDADDEIPGGIAGPDGVAHRVAHGRETGGGDPAQRLQGPRQ